MRSDVNDPQLVSKVASTLESTPTESPIFKNISAGLSHSTAVSDNGELYTWGSIEDGRLGLIIDKFVMNSKALDLEKHINLPTKINLINSKVQKAWAGGQFTVVLNGIFQVKVLSEKFS